MGDFFLTIPGIIYELFKRDGPKALCYLIPWLSVPVIIIYLLYEAIRPIFT